LLLRSPNAARLPSCPRMAKGSGAKHPSYRDIARKAGVSLMTVSLVMRNSQRISVATSTRVRRIAKQLGYTPDPRVAEIMGYLRTRRSVKDRPVLGLVNAREATVAKLWPKSFAAGIAQAAFQEAARGGYRLEEFWLGTAGMNDARLSNIIEARGVHGLLLLPLPPGRLQLDFRWSAFSAVSTCYLSGGIGLNQVLTNRQHYIELTLAKLRTLGYRRIGLAIDRDMDVRSNHQTLAHFLLDQSHRPKSERVKELFAPTLDVAALRTWLERQRPDVVVSPRNNVHGLLVSLGYRIPQDIGFASLAASAGDVPNLTGVDERPAMVGAAAVNFLTAQLQRGEIGLPKTRQLLLVEGGWIEGKTLRQVTRPEDQPPALA
jgi:LacI family transcriptional regulator